MEITPEREADQPIPITIDVELEEPITIDVEVEEPITIDVEVEERMSMNNLDFPEVCVCYEWR